MNPTPANSFVKQIPNLVTLSNLACGLIGITMVMQGHLVDGFFMMVLGAIMDFFDGAVARLLKANSPLGLQLDSLADVVTFGVLPGLIWREEMQMQGYCSTGFCINNYVWLFIPLGAAYRLAKFNIDTRQSTGFLGVPTPITGLALASWSWIVYTLDQPTFSVLDIREILTHYYFWLYVPLLASYMMISDFPMLALKFKGGDPLNVWKYALLGIGVISIVLFGAAGVAVFYFIYIIISFIANFAVQKQANKS
jgi:CDP-diacylglycerol--serine O-phosphatidyltransferase